MHLYNYKTRKLTLSKNPITEAKSPDTPLRLLLETLSPSLRSRFKGVKLNPKLGFNTATSFDTVEQLYVWLGGYNKKIYSNQRLPYMSYLIAGFNRKLEINDLILNCAQYPQEDIKQTNNI